MSMENYFYEGEEPCYDCGDPINYFAKGGSNWMSTIKNDDSCTGSNLGSSSCPPGSDKFRLAKYFIALAKKRFGKKNKKKKDEKKLGGDNMFQNITSEQIGEMNLNNFKDFLAQNTNAIVTQDAFANAEEKMFHAGGDNQGVGDNYDTFSGNADNDLQQRQLIDVIDNINKQSKEATAAAEVAGVNFFQAMKNTFGPNSKKVSVRKDRVKPGFRPEYRQWRRDQKNIEGASAGTDDGSGSNITNAWTQLHERIMNKQDPNLVKQGKFTPVDMTDLGNIPGMTPYNRYGGTFYRDGGSLPKAQVGFGMPPMKPAEREYTGHVPWWRDLNKDGKLDQIANMSPRGVTYLNNDKNTYNTEQGYTWAELNNMKEYPPGFDLNEDGVLDPIPRDLSGTDIYQPDMDQWGRSDKYPYGLYTNVVNKYLAEGNHLAGNWVWDEDSDPGGTSHGRIDSGKAVQSGYENE